MKKYCTLLLLLAACEQHNVATAYAVKTPVAIPCVAALPAEPYWLANNLPAEIAPPDYLKAILSDYTMMKAYIEVLKTMLQACM